MSNLIDLSFPTPDPVDLYVENGSGTLAVHADDTTESRVQISGRDADTVAVDLTGGRLSIIPTRQRSGFFTGDSSLHMQVTVPTGSVIAAKVGSADLTARGEYAGAHLKSGSGDVFVERVTGPGVVESGSGEVRIEAAASELRIKSGSGEVEVARVGGALSVSTGSGNVTVGSNDAAASVKTGSGDLHVASAHTDVAFTTGSGDLVIDSAVRGAFKAKGASGDITIGVPQGTPVWTDVSTVSGTISSTLESLGAPEEGADYVELRTQTVSGDILLRHR